MNQTKHHKRPYSNPSSSSDSPSRRLPHLHADLKWNSYFNSLRSPNCLASPLTSGPVASRCNRLCSRRSRRCCCYCVHFGWRPRFDCSGIVDFGYLVLDSPSQVVVSLGLFSGEHADNLPDWEHNWNQISNSTRGPPSCFGQISYTYWNWLKL